MAKLPKEVQGWSIEHDGRTVRATLHVVGESLVIRVAHFQLEMTGTDLPALRRQVEEEVKLRLSDEKWGRYIAVTFAGYKPADWSAARTLTLSYNFVGAIARDGSDPVARLRDLQPGSVARHAYMMQCRSRRLTAKGEPDAYSSNVAVGILCGDVLIHDTPEARAGLDAILTAMEKLESRLKAMLAPDWIRGFLHDLAVGRPLLGTGGEGA